MRLFLKILILSALPLVLVLSVVPGASTNSQDKYEDGLTALMRAARDGERENIKALLDQGVEVNAKDNNGWTALTYAVINGDSQVVKDLLAKGAEVNPKSEEGYTPLIAAVHYKHSSLVKMLLDKGADVNTLDKNGNTALTAAVRLGDSKIIGMLEKAGGTDPKRGVATSMDSQPIIGTRPVPLNKPAPSYTSKARDKGITGTVRARVLVDAAGTVKKVRILKGLPYGLSYTAMDAAYQMRFKPATKDDKPVAYWVVIEIEFRLR
jgi:TonB family protein